MASLESNDLNQMRQDAIRRSQEMYRRAQAPPGYSGSAFAEPKQEQAQQPEVPPQPAKQEDAAPAAPPAKQPDFFETLFSDRERNLVLSILLLLMEEKETDPALTFALLYLLL